MSDRKYISKYSNNKEVSAAQYITEMICEHKAKNEKKDLHYRFWLNPIWSRFYRNQIASANKLVQKYDDRAIVRALKNDKASKIYSLRAPHLVSIIEEEQTKLESENSTMFKVLERPTDVVFSKNQSEKKKNIVSKLKDIDHEC